MRDEELTEHARLAVIEATLHRIEHRLFGNGQPGLIDTLQKRVGRLEWYLAIAVGGGAVILWLLERTVTQ